MTKIPPQSALFSKNKRRFGTVGYFYPQTADWNSDKLLEGYPFDSGLSANSLVLTSSYTITNYAPTLSSGVRASPNTQGIAITRYAPTVGSGANTTLAARSVAITNYAPSVGISSTANPTAQGIVITGRQATTATSSNYTAVLGTSQNIAITGRTVTPLLNASVQIGFESSYPWYGNFYGTASPTMLFQGKSVVAELRTDVEAQLNTVVEYPWYGNWYGTPGISLHIRGYEVHSELHIVANVIPGAITITGHQPTVVVPAILEAKLNFEVEFPWYGNWYGRQKTTIPVSGFAPTVDISIVANAGKQSLAITQYGITTAVGHTASPANAPLVITGLAPIVTIGVPALANLLAGSVAITGRTPTISAQAITNTQTGAITITGYQPTVNYSVVADVVTSALTLTQYNVVSVAGTISTLNNVRQLNITGLPVSASTSVNATPLTHEIFITGREPSYIFGTTAAISGKQSLTITPYNILTSSSDQIVNQTGALNITGHAVTASGSVTATAAGNNPLLLTAYSVTGKSDSVAITGKSSLFLTTYKFDTVSSDGIDALITPGNLVITGYLTGAGMSPPAAILGSSQLKVTGYNVLPIVYTFISNSEIEIEGKQPTVTSTAAATVAARTVTISGKQVVVEVNENANTDTTNITISGLPLTTNVIYDALFGNVQNIDIVQRQQSAQISYDRTTLTSSMSLSEHAPTTAINYIQNLAATQQMLIDGKNIIADDNAQLAQLGVGSLNIDGYYTRSGVYKRRRRAFIN